MSNSYGYLAGLGIIMILVYLGIVALMLFISYLIMKTAVKNGIRDSILPQLIKEMISQSKNASNTRAAQAQPAQIVASSQGVPDAKSTAQPYMGQTPVVTGGQVGMTSANGTQVASTATQAKQPVCPFCGGNVNPSAGFCRHCGNVLR